MKDFDAGEIQKLAKELDITLLEQKAHIGEGQIEHIAKVIEQEMDGQRFVVNWGTWDTESLDHAKNELVITVGATLPHDAKPQEISKLKNLVGHAILGSKCSSGVVHSAQAEMDLNENSYTHKGGLSFVLYKDKVVPNNWLLVFTTRSARQVTSQNLNPIAKWSLLYYFSDNKEAGTCYDIKKNEFYGREITQIYDLQRTSLPSITDLITTTILKALQARFAGTGITFEEINRQCFNYFFQGIWNSIRSDKDKLADFLLTNLCVVCGYNDKSEGSLPWPLFSDYEIAKYILQTARGLGLTLDLNSVPLKLKEVTGQKDFSTTAIMFAAKKQDIDSKEHIQLMNLLIEHGADPIKTDKNDLDAFCYAIQVGNTEIVKYLYKHIYESIKSNFSKPLISHINLLNQHKLKLPDFNNNEINAEHKNSDDDTGKLFKLLKQSLENIDTYEQVRLLKLLEEISCHSYDRLLKIFHFPGSGLYNLLLIGEKEETRLKPINKYVLPTTSSSSLTLMPKPVTDTAKLNTNTLNGLSLEALQAEYQVLHCNDIKTENSHEQENHDIKSSNDIIMGEVAKSESCLSEMGFDLSEEFDYQGFESLKEDEKINFMKIVVFGYLSQKQYAGTLSQEFIEGAQSYIKENMVTNRFSENFKLEFVFEKIKYEGCGVLKGINYLNDQQKRELTLRAKKEVKDWLPVITKELIDRYVEENNRAKLHFLIYQQFSAKFLPKRLQGSCFEKLKKLIENPKSNLSDWGPALEAAMSEQATNLQENGWVTYLELTEDPITLQGQPDQDAMVSISHTGGYFHILKFISGKSKGIYVTPNGSAKSQSLNDLDVPASFTAKIKKQHLGESRDEKHAEEAILSPKSVSELSEFSLTLHGNDFSTSNTTSKNSVASPGMC